MKQLTQEQIEALRRPLPPEAIKPHPRVAGLSSIEPIYVIDRLNEVFGVGGWQTQVEAIETAPDKMPVVKLTFTVPEYGISLQHFGGNNNADRGDEYKGAATDALTKIASLLEIGAHVWRNKPVQQQGQPAPAEDARISNGRERLMELLDQFPAEDQTFAGFRIAMIAANSLDVQKQIAGRIKELLPTNDPAKQFVEHSKSQPA